MGEAFEVPVVTVTGLSIQQTCKAAKRSAASGQRCARARRTIAAGAPGGLGGPRGCLPCDGPACVAHGWAFRLKVLNVSCMQA